MKNNILAFSVFLIFLNNLSAHVELDQPEGGETYAVGDTIEIVWHNLVIHDPIDWDLYFSSDGGENWQLIATGLPINQFNYQWVVPNAITEMGQIRIVQDNTGADYEDKSENFTITENVLGVFESEKLPDGISIVSNFPNPFNPSTTIVYHLVEMSNLNIEIYDMLGHLVTNLDSGLKEARTHSIKWDGTDLKGNYVSSGIYIYRLHSGKFDITKKMMLIK